VLRALRAGARGTCSRIFFARSFWRQFGSYMRQKRIPPDVGLTRRACYG